MGYITMNKKECKQSKVFEQIKQGMISRVKKNYIKLTSNKIKISLASK